MQTIPDDVLDKIVGHHPHLAAVVDNLRRQPALAETLERQIAATFLLGTAGPLTALEAWHLASCAAGKPYGADHVWLDVPFAAGESGYDAAHVRRLIANGTIAGAKRRGVWWVRREEVMQRPRDPRGRPRKSA